MFLYPLNTVKEEEKQLERMYLYQETVQFVDDVRNTGWILSEDMEDYLGKISGMNTLYDIKITHESAVTGDEPENTYQLSTFKNEIFDRLDKDKKYELNYQDFIRIVICDTDENMVICYGGCVKAIHDTVGGNNEIN